MSGNIEKRYYTGDSEAKNLLLEKHVKHAADRVLSMHKQLDARMAQRIGFDGNILDEVSQSSKTDMDSRVRRYVISSSYFNLYGKESNYSIRHLNTYESKERLIDLNAGDLALKFTLASNNEPIFLEASAGDEGIRLDLQKKSPIKIKRSYKKFSSFVEYDLINEAGDLKIAEAAEIEVQLPNIIGRACFTDQKMDWQSGLIALSRIDEESGALIINEEDYASGSCVFPLKANLYTELNNLESWMS